MTNLPDSGWLATINKVDWWVSAAIATAAAVVLALAHFDAPWFGQLPPKLALMISVAGILFFCLFLFRGIDLIYHAAKESHLSKVSRRFNQLSDRQRKYLLEIFQSSSRGFEVLASTGSPRWLEELENWNYIERYSLMIIMADTPDYYTITEAGWQQLEKHQRKSN